MWGLVVSVATKELAADVPLQNEILQNGESAEYHLRGLEADKDYEVRISYPATVVTYHVHASHR